MWHYFCKGSDNIQWDFLLRSKLKQLVAFLGLKNNASPSVFFGTTGMSKSTVQLDGSDQESYSYQYRLRTQVGKCVTMLHYYTYFYLSECQYGHCLCGVFCGTTTNETEALKQLTNQS